VLVNSKPSRQLVAVLITLLAAGPAAAEIPLARANGWNLTLDGRLNTFGSFSQGDAQPSGVASWTGVEDKSASTDRITMTRMRGGFLNNVLGFNLIKQLSPDLRVTGRFATWVGVSQERSKTDNPGLDAREVYVRLEGSWGGLLAGRNLALFERGAIRLDYELQHANGLGHPCAIRTVRGGACGYAGHGLLFPAYSAGLVYNTPVLAGFQLSAGLYDPAVISDRQYERTPYPRIEAELTFDPLPGLGLFVDGLWQRIGNNADPLLNPDVAGIAAGGRVGLGPLAAGFAYYTGQGLGLYIPMENSPLFADEEGVLRKTHGYVGMVSATVDQTKIAAGAGVSRLMTTLTESEPFATLTIPRRQLGISAGFYQGFYETLTLALEYFRGNYRWYDSTDATSGAVRKNEQTVHFVNVGLTMIF
jgi:Gram-negative porin